MEITRRKIEGKAAEAFYVNGIVNGHSVTFRIDTGADLTCIPDILIRESKNAEKQYPFSRKDVLIQDHAGIVARFRRRIATIEIDGQEYRPGKGVLITNSSFGLLGNDILFQMDMLCCGSLMILEPNTHTEERQ